MIQGNAYEFDNLHKLVGDSAVNNKRSHEKKYPYNFKQVTKIKKRFTTATKKSTIIKKSQQ